jgi:hypothetical protein
LSIFEFSSDFPRECQNSILKQVTSIAFPAGVTHFEPNEDLVKQFLLSIVPGKFTMKQNVAAFWQLQFI